MTFVIPPKSSVGYLDAELAGEGQSAGGQKIIHSDGTVVAWNPPPPQPVMPDMSQIKTIRHYFGRTGHQVWPAWLYHPTEPPCLVKDAQEAMALGVCYRKTTDDERNKFGATTMWDWTEDSQWRPNPHKAIKFDPLNPGQGKTYIAAQRAPEAIQSELVQSVVAAATAAVMQTLKAADGAKAPGNVDPAQWEDFLRFQAFQASSKVAQATVSRETSENAEVANVLNALVGEAEPDERQSWIDEASRLNISVDKRWATERIKDAVLKAKAA